MMLRPPVLILAGALASMSIGIAGAAHSDQDFAAKLAASAKPAIQQLGGDGISAEPVRKFG